MDWTTLVAYLSGSVDEERRLRNQQPAPHGQGRGCRVGGSVWALSQILLRGL